MPRVLFKSRYSTVCFYYQRRENTYKLWVFVLSTLLQTQSSPPLRIDRASLSMSIYSSKLSLTNNTPPIIHPPLLDPPDHLLPIPTNFRLSHTLRTQL